MFHPRCMYPARTGTHTTCVQRERFSAARCNYFSPGHSGSDHSFFAPSDSKGAATSGGRGRKEGREGLAGKQRSIESGTALACRHLWQRHSIPIYSYMHVRSQVEYTIAEHDGQQKRFERPTMCLKAQETSAGNVLRMRYRGRNDTSWIIQSIRPSIVPVGQAQAPLYLLVELEKSVPRVRTISLRSGCSGWTILSP